MKSYLSIAGAVLLAAMLAACGGGANEAEDAPEAVNGEVEDADTADNRSQESWGADDVEIAGGDQPEYSEGTDPDFVSGCLETSNLSREMCVCMAASAAEELNENELGFLIASMNQDADRATEIRMNMSMAEVTNAAMFMGNATRDCAERGFAQ